MKLTRTLTCIVASLFGASANGVPFEEMEIKPGDRVAIYLGTFNPITLGHQETIEYAVKTGVRVVVIPRDIILHKSGAYPYRTRLGLVEAVYAKNPNVGYPTASYWFPNINGISLALKKKKATIVGMVGQDIMQSTKYSWLNTTVMFGRVDEWLMAERAAEAGFEVPKEFAGKPVRSLSELVDVSTRKYTDASSTLARKTLQSRPDFFLNNATIDASALPLDPKVAAVVRRQLLFASEEVTMRHKCTDLESQKP